MCVCNELISDKKMNKDIIVSVVMITFKHEKCIKQAIEGVLMQQSNFTVELIIGDDNSPDRTEEIVKKIIREHPNSNWIKYTKHQQNKGIIPNFNWALDQAKGKYIAICDGDDYWTDPLKLQKQVDVLDKNELVGLVHSQFSTLKIAEGIIKTSTDDRNKTSFEELLLKNPIVTSTTCFRKELYIKYMHDIKPSTKFWIAGDTPIWLWFAFHSKIHYLNEATTVNHIISGSASNTNSSRKHFDFIKSRLSIKKYFINKYNGSAEALKYIYDDFYRESEYHAIKLKEIETIRENIKNLRCKGLIVKPNFLHLLCKYHSNDNIYNSLFFFYKIYNRLKIYLYKTK